MNPQQQQIVDHESSWEIVKKYADSKARVEKKLGTGEQLRLSSFFGKSYSTAEVRSLLTN